MFYSGLFAAFHKETETHWAEPAVFEREIFDLLEHQGGLWYRPRRLKGHTKPDWSWEYVSVANGNTGIVLATSYIAKCERP